MVLTAPLASAVSTSADAFCNRRILCSLPNAYSILQTGAPVETDTVIDFTPGVD
jgi:hypothetical protein